MSLNRKCSILMKALQRVVATLAVVSLLSAVSFDGVHHGAHAGHHQPASSAVTTILDTSVLDKGVLHHEDCDPLHTSDPDPSSPSNHGEDDGDCTHCCAAHCFACVMPTGASVLEPWLISKKGIALGLFAAPPPTWRLERPPKTSL